ncbi:MAG: calycin-like domain-containing protein [Muribaculaceae bacterium]|nr:calycin-like domain-containing protein [Muribaculaceae bacterium]
MKIMKKTVKFLSAIMVAAGLLTSLSLQSCSDDNNDEPAAPAAKSVAGSYTGDLGMTVMGSTDTTEDVTFSLTATDDTHATLTFPTYGNPPMQIQEFDIPGLAVTKDGETYKIARTDYEQTLANGRTASGAVEGDVVDGVLTLRFTLLYGAMPMEMVGNFSGSKN